MSDQNESNNLATKAERNPQSLEQTSPNAVPVKNEQTLETLDKKTASEINIDNSWNVQPTTSAQDLPDNAISKQSNAHTVDGAMNDDVDSNKRAALAGQWRTPPTVLFSSGVGVTGADQQLSNNIQQQTNGAQTVQQPLASSANQPSHQIMHSQQPAALQGTQYIQQPQHGVLQQQHIYPIQYQQQPMIQQSQAYHVVQNFAQGSVNTTDPALVTSNSNMTLTNSTGIAPNASNSSVSALEGSHSVVFPGVPASLVANVPCSTEDYAKALQEAYRRGAEAAARAAASQVVRSDPSALSNMNSTHNLVNLVPAVSCPDFSTTQPILTQPAHQTQSHVSQHHVAPSSTVIPMVQSIPSQFHPMPSSMAMPPPPPVTSSVPDPMQYQHTPMMVHHASVNHVDSGIGQPPQQQLPQQTFGVQQPQQHYGQRSVSLPDMSSYAVQQEEEKRQKRLARNRASARIRRLRKKNLVDAYEVEVGILEKTLQLLKEHEWGGPDDEVKDGGGGNTEGRASALAAALSMDRGQQLLTAEQRKTTATDILQQQLVYLDQLESLLQEQFILHEIARMHLNISEKKDGEEDNFDDLKQLLQLSEEQIVELHRASANWEEEWHALQTVKASLRAMKDNDWLWNEGCVETVDQFLQILHKNQISKFLLWCDHNVEAIEELDCVNAGRPESTDPGPVFYFGVDCHPGGENGDFFEDDKV